MLLSQGDARRIALRDESVQMVELPLFAMQEAGETSYDDEG